MVPRVEAAGFRAIELTQAYAQLDRYPQNTPLGRIACHLTSPAVGEQVRTVIEAESPDALLIDSMFPAALDAATEYGIPSAVFFHHFLFRLRDEWKATEGRFYGMREQAGFSPLPPFEDLWQRQDRIIITSPAQFDTPIDPAWTLARHVGPVLEDEKCAVSIDNPWEDDDRTPLVLVSFSTAPEQRSLEKFQRSLDALGQMPVHVIGTTAGIVALDELCVPQNALVVPYAAHDPVLKRASLIITHGGHGTVMRSLKYGVPMIVMPGLAHDQAPNGRMVQDWGAGIALAGDAHACAIATAAQSILSSPSYKDAARRLSSILAASDGASSAADEVEMLLDAAAQRVNYV